MSDTKKFRQALKDAGIRQPRYYLAPVYNDKHKNGTRRLKLWSGDAVFEASRAVQEKLERQLKEHFGRRYLFGQFVRRMWSPRIDEAAAKSFCVYLLVE